MVIIFKVRKEDKRVTELVQVYTNSKWQVWEWSFNKITLPSYGSFADSYTYNVHTNLSRHYMTSFAYRTEILKHYNSCGMS